MCRSFDAQEYTSEEEGSEPDADLENQYYQSKALKEEDAESAIRSFEKVFSAKQHHLISVT